MEPAIIYPSVSTESSIITYVKEELCRTRREWALRLFLFATLSLSSFQLQGSAILTAQFVIASKLGRGTAEEPRRFFTSSIRLHVRCRFSLLSDLYASSSSHCGFICFGWCSLRVYRRRCSIFNCFMSFL